jgi:hypothetical protein
MDNVAVKSTGSTFSASEYNPSQEELENSVTDSGQALGGDKFQLSKAMSINAAAADYYNDSGAADVYVLSKPGTSSLRSPAAYLEGMNIRFRPANNNTSGSTVNVAGIGAKSILKAGGGALSAGDISVAQDTVARFDLGANAFVLLGVAPDATKASKGVLFLGDQRIILSNNSGDPDSDINFSGGRFTFADGTGQEIVGALIKQLDSVFVPGNNQGGLDVLPKAADTTYHCFAMFKPSNGNCDYAFTVNAAGPTLVGNLVGYTKKRRIGAILAGGSGNILGFIQVGKYFYLNVEALSDTRNFTTTADIVDLDVPVGIPVISLLTVLLNITSNSTVDKGVRFSNPDTADIVATFSNSQINTKRQAGLNNWIRSGAFEVLTNDLGQVRGRASAGVASALDTTTVRGWIDINLEG